MVYADDTQLYLVVKPDDCTSSILKLEKCVQDIRTCQWNIKNKLVLNDGKTEIIHIYIIVLLALISILGMLLSTPRLRFVT